ncbi:thioredoxin family protein [Cetobacterium sp.]|uniref:thioredoxin family protein n=1 Tax=Cetobacterium sp. TaxID=2071632 RepID=UPI003F328786
MELKELKNQCRGNSVNMIVFSATWCGPCKIYEKELEKSKVKHIKLDVDNCDEICLHLDVRHVPSTYYLDENAKVIKKEIGIRYSDVIISLMKEIEEKS